MAIIRSPRRHKYTVVENVLINDARIKCDAMGVLVYLLSKPDHWNANPDELRKRFSIGKDKVYRILSELIEAGYVNREVRRDATGQAISHDYIVHEVPTTPENTDTGTGFSEQLPENPDLGDQLPENPDHSKYGLSVSTDSSVSNETGSGEPETVARRLFDKTLNYLKRSYPTIAEQNLRGRIGKWRSRARDDTKLLGIVETAMRQCAADPLTYLEKAVDQTFAKPPDPRRYTPEKWKSMLDLVITGEFEWDEPTMGKPPGHPKCVCPKELITPDLMARFKPEGAML